jgi:hypothetical protein
MAAPWRCRRRPRSRLSVAARDDARSGLSNRWRALAVLVVVVGAAIAVGSLASTPRTRRPASGRGGSGRDTYDFDRDGRQELVIALFDGSVRGSSTRSGVVLVHRGRRADPPWRVITESRAGVPGRPRAGDQFGLGLASDDFDRDGHADLAIGTPGRDRVSVLYGGPAGLGAGRRQQIAGSPRASAGRVRALRLPPAGAGPEPRSLRRPGRQRARRAPGAAGHRRAADHLRGLLGPRSGSLARDPAAGGGARGLRHESAERRRRRATDTSISWRAPRRASSGPVMAVYCPGSERGPIRLPTVRVAGRQLQPRRGGRQRRRVRRHHPGRLGLRPVRRRAPAQRGGAVVARSRRGPRSVPLTITQTLCRFTARRAGRSVRGRRRGGRRRRGRLRRHARQRRSRERGGREGDGHPRRPGGFATVGNSSFGQGLPAVPGAARPDAEFGSSLTVLHLSGDRRPDVAVAAKGGATAQERIMVVRGGTGVFAPDETRTSTLPSVAGQVVARKGSRIRLARTAGG